MSGAELTVHIIAQAERLEPGARLLGALALECTSFCDEAPGFEARRLRLLKACELR